MKKMNLLLVLGTSLLCCSGVVAQRVESEGVLKSSRQLDMEWADHMRENFQTWTSSRPAKPFTLKFDSKQKPMPMKASSAAEETLILSEDFSKFTAGSEETPDSQDLSYLGEGMNIPEEYTQTSGWMGDKVFQAGGCAFIDHTVLPGASEEENVYIQGCLYTPVIDLSGNDGIFTITFRAKTLDQNSDILNIKTYVQADEYYRYVDDENEMTINDEWQTYTIALTKGSTSNRICFLTNSSNFYIDDITIKSGGLPQPTGSTASQYTGTSVVLSWNRMPEAESYLLDLYYKDENGNSVYKLKDEETADTTFSASGLVVENTYFFTVRAKNASGISPYSEEYAILSELVSPDLMSCINYTGDSFMARWRPVEGATSYLLSVYNLVVDNYTMVPVYLLRQEETTDTCMTVTGCDPSLTYYYTVQSKGAGVSLESGYAMPAVPQLTAPALLEPSNVTSNGFTANWEEVPYAEGYTPFLYKEHTAMSDQSLSIIDTDFADAVCPPSYQPWGDMTITDPFQSFSPFYFDEFAGMADWYISVTAFADGALGLDNMYPDFFDMGYLISPKLDFSLGDGTVKIDVDWLSIHASSTTDVYAVVAFATVGEDNSINIEGTPQTFLVPKETLKHETITLTGGQPDSYLIIFTEDNGIIMFDNLKVEMSMDKDQKVMLPLMSLFTEETSMDFNDLENLPGERYAYNVSSAYIGDGTFPYQSGFSDLQFINLLPSSVTSETIDAGAKAYVKAGKLYVENPDNEPVSLYDVKGSQLMAIPQGETEAVYDLPGAGLYIVKVGNKAMKVVR